VNEFLPGFEPDAAERAQLRFVGGVLDLRQFDKILVSISGGKDSHAMLWLVRDLADRQGVPRKYGFHTNIATKPMIISTLVKVIREHLYTERDKRCLDEYLTYERKQNGAYGAIVGKHDDLLMTRAIGMHICFYEMEIPRIIPKQQAPVRKRKGPVSEAVF